MDKAKEVSTEDAILQAKAGDEQIWQRTLRQIRKPESSLASYEVLAGIRPFDQEID